MALALPFDGVAPLLLHVVFHPFELGHTSVERKVLVESFELRGEVPLLIAPSPMAVLLQPCVGTVQEFSTAFLRRNADDGEFALGIDPADVFEAQKLERYRASRRRRPRAREQTAQRATSVSCPAPISVQTSPCGG